MNVFIILLSVLFKIVIFIYYSFSFIELISSHLISRKVVLILFFLELFYREIVLFWHSWNARPKTNCFQSKLKCGFVYFWNDELVVWVHWLGDLSLTYPIPKSKTGETNLWKESIVFLKLSLSRWFFKIWWDEISHLLIIHMKICFNKNLLNIFRGEYCPDKQNAFLISGISYWKIEQ